MIFILIIWDTMKNASVPTTFFKLDIFLLLYLQVYVILCDGMGVWCFKTLLLNFCCCLINTVKALCVNECSYFFGETLFSLMIFLHIYFFFKVDSAKKYGVLFDHSTDYTTKPSQPHKSLFYVRYLFSL